MKKEEIDRIKGGVGRAILKDPKNKILRDLETAILTIEKYRATIESLKGCCVLNDDHSNYCEEELKVKDQWCGMCRVLDVIGVSQLDKS